VSFFSQTFLLKLTAVYLLLFLDFTEVLLAPGVASLLRTPHPPPPPTPYSVLTAWLLNPNLTASDTDFAWASQRGEFPVGWWERSVPGIPLPLIPLPLNFWFTWLTPNFSWILYASVLSVLAAYPSAAVKVASNTLPLDTFACLGAYGSVEVVRYNMLELSRELGHGLELQWFIGNDTIAKNKVRPEFRHSHTSDLLRFLLLERHGGVYCDTDLMLTAPLPQWVLEAPFATASNPITPKAVEASYALSHEGAMLASGFLSSNTRFSQGRTLLHQALNLLPTAYDPHKWACIGPNLINDAVLNNLLTNYSRPQEEEDALRLNEGLICANCYVEILDSEVVYPLHESVSWLLLHPNISLLEEAWHPLKRQLSYAVHVSTSNWWRSMKANISLAEGPPKGSYLHQHLEEMKTRVMGEGRGGKEACRALEKDH